jgi:heme/copper-type cytochrome/quinol oxidase subunit 2
MIYILTESPSNWQIFFQNPATPVMEGIIGLHNYIMIYLILVFVIVMWFLIRSLYLFKSSGNLLGTDFSHDNVLESVWTITPVFVLIAIAIPSFSLLYSMDEVSDPYITVKAIGHQWYWSYEMDVVGVDYPIRYLLEASFNVDDEYSDFYPYIMVKHPYDTIELSILQKKLLSRSNFKLKLKTKINDRYTRFLKKVSFQKVDDKKAFLFDIRGILLANSIRYLKSLQYDVFKDYLDIRFIDATSVYLSGYFSHYMPTVTDVKLLTSVEWVNPSVSFDSYMLNNFSGLRLLDVDNQLFLPINTHIRFLITSTDVIHSWSVPSFGVKVDAVPGRLNQTGIFIKREGTFYGQCSELCGVNHGFMPIKITSVDLENFFDLVSSDYNQNLDSIAGSEDWVVRIDQ